MGTWLPETYREQNKELCVKLVIYKDYTEMHGQQNIKLSFCLACVSFPAVTPYILKQIVIFDVLIQTNSPFFSTLQAMTLLISIRKVPIPNPFYELNIQRCFMAQVYFSFPTPGHYLTLDHDHFHPHNFPSFGSQCPQLVKTNYIN
jgi:hypothetical protein